jgi:hypothetical protein
MKKKKVIDQSYFSATFLSLALFGWVAPLLSHAGIPVSELKQLYGADLRVAGLIEQIDVKSNRIVVSGQLVVVGKSTKFAEAGVQHPDLVVASGLLALRLGDYVAINGLIDAPAASVTRLSEQYVPGSSTIYVHGALTTIDSTTGIGKFGGLQVDFTPAMSDASVAGIQTGEILEVSGTQPASDGVLLTESVVTGQSAKSIVGTSGLKSIVGTSGLKSIVGTSGLKSIVGTSGLKSIVGTSGLKSIVGTSGARSIVGTSGAYSIVGTSGAHSIVGTSGAKSIVGTSGLKSIVGTSGLKSIVGTSGARSIVGTS